MTKEFRVQASRSFTVSGYRPVVRHFTAASEGVNRCTHTHTHTHTHQWYCILVFFFNLFWPVYSFDSCDFKLWTEETPHELQHSGFFFVVHLSKIWVKITQLVYKSPEWFISELSRPPRWSRSGLFLSSESKLNTEEQCSGFIHHTSGTNSQKNIESAPTLHCFICLFSFF